MPNGLRQYSRIKRLLAKYDVCLSEDNYAKFMMELADILGI